MLPKIGENTPAPAGEVLSLSCPICNKPQRTDKWLAYHLKKYHERPENTPALPREGTHRAIIHVRLKCPQCRAARVRVVDLDHIPTMIECTGCGELVPGGAWYVQGFRN